MAENKGLVIDPEKLSSRDSMAFQLLRASQP
jgi:hypothetical protein